MTQITKPSLAVIFMVAIIALVGCPDTPEPVYEIMYHLSGGTNHLDNPATYRMDSPDIILGEPSRIGYTFDGWYPDQMYGGTVTTTIPTSSEGDIDLYAKWIAQTYTVSFDAQGGTELSLDTKQVTFDSAYGELATVTFNEVGYTFGGWYTQPLGAGTKIEVSTMVKTAAHHSLYAYKAAIVYGIEYVLNGGSNPGTYPETYTIESDAILLDDPQRDGYDFAGWYDNPDFTGTLIVDIPKGSHADVVLFAKWTLHLFAITYHLNDGLDPGTNPATYTIESDDIVLNDPNRNGYLFDSWYGAADFSGPVVTTIPSGSIGDKHLYAKWTPQSYAITYILNGGTNAPANPTTYTIESADIVFIDPTRAGHTFEGWFADAVFSGPVVTLIEHGSAGDVSVYAKWTANTYAASFDAGLGTVADPVEKQVTFGGQYGALATTSRVGYAFGGWYTQTDGGGIKIEPTSIVNVAADHTLYAQWIANSYMVSFNAGPGSAATPAEKQVTYGQEYGDLATTDRLGYTLGGWYTEVGGGGIKIEPSVVVTTDVDHTLYAKWIANTYTVIFDAQGGEVPTDSVLVTFDSTYGDLPTATKHGYTFLGWNTTANGSGDDVESTSMVGTAMDHTVYAKWQAIVYPITYELNGGTNHVANPSEYTIETTTITLSEPHKNGYSFQGWYIDAGFGGTAITDIPLGSTGAKTFHAKWTPTVYAITYELYGGTNAGANPATYTIETATITFSEPVKNGYTFLGWYGDAGYTGDAVTQMPLGSTGNQTVYAKWQAIVYPITYELNAGTNHVDNPDTYTVEDAVGLGVPTRGYYDFQGWYSDSEFSGPAITDIPLGSTGAKTFHAKWTPTVYAITYQLYGGINNGDNPPTYTIETATITFSEPSRAGYYFAGWFLEDSFDTMEHTIEHGSHGAIMLHAKWNVLYQIGNHVPSPGGIVFYDNVAYDYRVDQWRYLAAMEMDIPGTVEWIAFNPTYDDDEFRLVGGTSEDIGTGYENSQRMLDKADFRNSAANACIGVDGNEAWHLPSRYELDKVYKNLYLNPMIVTNFQAATYWSSSEEALDLAWSQNFATGIQNASATVNTYKFIPIRRL